MGGKHLHQPVLQQLQTIAKTLDSLGYALADIQPEQRQRCIPGRPGGLSVHPAGDGTLLAIIPLLVLYVFCQKFFIQSVERTGIVG